MKLPELRYQWTQSLDVKPRHTAAFEPSGPVLSAEASRPAPAIASVGPLTWTFGFSAPLRVAATLATPPTPEERLTRAINDDDAHAIAAVLKDAPELLERQNENGLTPIFNAVERYRPRAFAALVHAGANLHHINNQGRNILTWACRCLNEDIVRLILDTPKLADTTYPLWHTPVSLAGVARDLAAQADSTAAADSAANKLWWIVSTFFGEPWQLQKLLTHNQGMVKNPYGVPAEYWDVAEALCMRGRAILEYAASTTGQDRRLLLREVSLVSEALRCIGDVREIRRLGDQQLQGRVFRNLAKSTMRRVLGLSSLPCVIPAGWKGHTLYITLEANRLGKHRFISLRVDNLGDGRDAHARTGHKVWPYVVNVPVTESAMAALEDFLTTALASEEDDRSNAFAFYSALNKLSARMILAGGPSAVPDMRQSDAGGFKQEASNCTLANWGPGMHARLGAELYDKLLADEFTRTHNRLLETATPSALAAAVAQNTKRIEDIRAT